jgi:hypothetical protein
MSLERYIGNLPLSEAGAMPESAGKLIRKSGPVTGSPPITTQPLQPFQQPIAAAVDAGSIISFAGNIDAGQASDVLYTVQFAQRAANAAFDRFAQTRSWYSKYAEVLEALGWVTEQFAFAAQNQTQGEFKMDKAALAVITEIATAGQLAAITQTLKALEGLADGSNEITVFELNALAKFSGNFQIGAVEPAPNGLLSMASGAFYFRTAVNQGKFLFFRWGVNQVNFWTSAQKMTFNRGIYDSLRQMVQDRLGAGASKLIAEVKLS